MNGYGFFEYASFDRVSAMEETGRFLSQDKERGDKKNENTWNLYTYCTSDPINYAEVTAVKDQSIIVDGEKKLMGE